MLIVDRTKIHQIHVDVALAVAIEVTSFVCLPKMPFQISWDDLEFEIFVSATVDFKTVVDCLIYPCIEIQQLRLLEWPSHYSSQHSL